jgi:hypothetical protein
MSDGLVAPLLLTDRPWAEIEAQRKGPPLSTSPQFGSIMLQPIELPIVISAELWEMLNEGLRRRYEKAPPPAPVLLLEGPAAWEKERQKAQLTPGAVQGHKAVVAQIETTESDNRKRWKKDLKQWISTLHAFVSKQRPDSMAYYKGCIDRIKEYVKQEMYTQVGREVEQTNRVFLSHVALDAEILKLLKETDELNNKDLRKNIIEGNNFTGLNDIGKALDNDPESSLAIKVQLAAIKEKLADYKSRASNLRPGVAVRPRGPNGLYRLERADLSDRPTGRLYRSETRAAQTIARIADIDYLIQNGRLRANRDGPNPAYWHAHVGGDYKDNMIVRKSDLAIMGFVDGHISSKKEDRAGAQAASAIEGRNTEGQLVEILAIDGDLYEVV